MKALFMISILSAVLFSCSNSSNDTSTPTDSLQAPVDNTRNQQPAAVDTGGMNRPADSTANRNSGSDTLRDKTP